MLEKEGVGGTGVQGFFHLIFQIVSLLLTQFSSSARHMAAENIARPFQLKHVFQPLFPGKIRLLYKQVHQVIHIDRHRLCQTVLNAFLSVPAFLTL